MGDAMVDPASSFRNLSAIPKHEIVAQVAAKLTEADVAEKLRAITSKDLTLDELRRTDSATLVSWIRGGGLLSDDEAALLNEEYRYRGTKTIFLFDYQSEHRRALLNVLDEAHGAELLIVLQARLDSSPATALLKFTDLQFRQIDRFDVSGHVIRELVYSYVTQIHALSPETEELVEIPDLRFGFIWFSEAESWVAVSARDERVAVEFISVIADHTDIPLYQFAIPKSVEIDIEGYANVRRASHIDTRGVRHRVTHENLHSFADVVDDIQTRDRMQNRTSSGYNASVGDYSFVVSYNREKGAISLSKHLPATQLREFCVFKISQITSRIARLRRDTPDELVKVALGQKHRAVRRSIREPLDEILGQFATARIGQLEQIELNIDPLWLFSSYKFSTNLRFKCLECDDLQFIACLNCGEASFRLRGAKLQCAHCNAEFNAANFQCIEGHPGSSPDLGELIMAWPTRNVLRDLDDALLSARQPQFNAHEEGFYIQGNVLHRQGAHVGKTLLMLHDIPEFQSAAETILSASEKATILDELGKFREKCRAMSTVNCALCVSKRVGPQCFMRLFGLYDHTYTPRPHHGSEFGDVSLSITVDHRPDQRLAILLKKGAPTDVPITLRHKIGRDLFTQVQSYLRDHRVSVIGIAVPQTVDDGFIADLRSECFRHSKRLLVMQAEQLSQVVQAVIVSERAKGKPIGIADL